MAMFLCNMGALTPQDTNPEFTKTQLADNSTLSNTFTLSDDPSNYDLVEFVTINPSDITAENHFLMTAGCISDILNLDTTRKLLCFNNVSTNLYVAYTVSGTQYTQYNYRTIKVKEVNGYKCTNKTVTEDVLFNTTTKSDSYVASITSSSNIYDYDIILLGYNDTDDDEIGPCNNILYPTNLVGNNTFYCNNSYYNTFTTFFDAYNFYHTRNVYIRGIKFT